MLSDLQRVVWSFNVKRNEVKMLSDAQIEDQIVKAFQTLYPHFFNLNNITRVAN